VALARAQVLADGEDLDVVLAEDPERLHHLLERLPEADHEAALGHDVVAAHVLRVAQHARGAQELRAAAGDGVEAGHDLDVVVEDVGALGDDRREGHLLALEVGGEDLDLAAGRLAADLPDRRRPDPRSLVGQVVAVDARDDRVAEAHAGDRAGDARGLERVVVGRLAGLHVAEAAAPGARVPEDHERRGAALPAVPDVGAGGLLADRDEVLGLEAPGQLAVARAARHRDLEPRRLALVDGQDVRPEDLQDVHAARVGPRAGLVLARRDVGHVLDVSARPTPASGRR
jgi:hypothetical protein